MQASCRLYSYARLDKEYFEPLQQLKLGTTKLILGLAHYDDLDGTKTRIRSACEFVHSFGVSTECGMGRTPTEQPDSIFSILADVSGAVDIPAV